MKARNERQGRRPRKYDVWLFPLLTLLAIFLSGILARILPDQPWMSEAVRSEVESVGFLAGIFLAVLLLTQCRGDTSAVFRVWVPAGLLSLSILGEFHSFIPFGNSHVWLHSLAMLSGGLFFATGSLPFRAFRLGVKNVLVPFAATAALLLGIVSLSMPGILPEMISGHSFTVATVAVNLTSGLLFLAAAAFFFYRYVTTRNFQEMLFACFSGLHAAAGLSYPLELPWQEGWWLLHTLSYGILLIYSFVIFKKTEDKSRFAEESIRYIMETSMDGFFILNSEGRFIDANDAYCRLTGYDRQKLLRLAIPDLEANEKPEEVASHILRVIQNGSDRFETRHRARNGKVIDIEANVHYLPNGQLFAFVHDITARKAAQAQLIANDRLASIGLLASGIAHEVGNPLTVIMGYTNILLMPEAREEIQDGLRVIDEQSRRASSILRNLLAFARTESSEKKLMKINESITRVLGLRVFEHKIKRIDVNRLFTPDLPEIIGNRSRLEQVFYNIIVNAEFSMVEAHQRGVLTITTNRTDNVVRVIFTDDGMGISGENLGRLFTPFFTTKKVGEGTGLGLSICQGIINEHGGRIYAESVPGEGATFVIELPIPPVSCGITNATAVVQQMIGGDQ